MSRADASFDVSPPLEEFLFELASLENRGVFDSILAISNWRIDTKTALGDVAQISPASFREHRFLAQNFYRLKDDDRGLARQFWHDLKSARQTGNTSGAELPPNWYCSPTYTTPEAILALSGQMHQDGHDVLRASEVASIIQEQGAREVHNPSYIIRGFITQDEPWASVIDEASGRRSLGYKLNAAGMKQYKLLRDRAIKRSKPASPNE